MNAVKERILGAVTVMDNMAALRLWDFISNEFSGVDDVESQWAAIPEVAPDEIDLQMLREIESDEDCHDFVPADEAKRLLGL